MITAREGKILDHLVAQQAFIRRAAELAEEHGNDAVIEDLMRRAKIGREAAVVALDIALADSEERAVRETFNALHA